MKHADRRRRAKNLERKKLNVTQQAAVKGGVADGLSNTLMVATKLPAMELRPRTFQNQP